MFLPFPFFPFHPRRLDMVVVNVAPPRIEDATELSWSSALIVFTCVAFVLVREADDGNEEGEGEGEGDE